MSNSENGFQNPIAKLPKWAQWMIFVVVLFPVIFAATYFKDQAKDTPEASAMKKQMNPVAEKLVKAARAGDRRGATELWDATMKVKYDYLFNVDKNKALEDTAYRYCGIAAFMLDAGVNEVYETGEWTTRPKYEAAIAECK